MNLTIFGAGSIGSLFAGRIAYSGFNVSVIGRQPHITEIKKKGLCIIEENQEIWSQFKANTDLANKTLESDAIWITTKAYDNKIVADTLTNHINENTPIFILQNGMGNEEAFLEKFPNNPIFRGITTEAAELLHPGIIKHVAFGKTSFDKIRGHENGFGSKLSNTLYKSGFKVKRSSNIYTSMWQKLLTNATICPLGTILHVPNGEILKKPSIQKIFDSILKEGIKLANFHLPDEDFSATKDFILNVIEKTKSNKCSMLQDIERRRKTEIDYINGFIVRESHRLGLKAPVNAAIADLIRHIERYPQ